MAQCKPPAELAENLTFGVDRISHCSSQAGRFKAKPNGIRLPPKIAVSEHRSILNESLKSTWQGERDSKTKAEEISIGLIGLKSNDQRIGSKIFEENYRTYEPIIFELMNPVEIDAGYQDPER